MHFASWWSSLAALVVLASASVLPADTVNYTAARSAVVYGPTPGYPFEARLNFFEGKGIFLIRVDSETGLVKSVTIAKSTGHPILDDVSVKTLQRWRVKPHTFNAISIPINFIMDGAEAAQLRAIRAHVLFAPAPAYPLEARFHGVGGSGRFKLLIDPKTGAVTDVKILESTRDGRLDDASVKGFRRWRFVPHTIETVIVPVSF